MMDASNDDWIDRVYNAAAQVFGDGDVASFVAAMEKVYRERLKPSGSLDTEFARTAFGDSQEPLWRDAWKDARFRAAREGA